MGLKEGKGLASPISMPQASAQHGRDQDIFLEYDSHTCDEDGTSIAVLHSLKKVTRNSTPRLT